MQNLKHNYCTVDVNYSRPLRNRSVLNISDSKCAQNTDWATDKSFKNKYLHLGATDKWLEVSRWRASTTGLGSLYEMAISIARRRVKVVKASRISWRAAAKIENRILRDNNVC